MQTRKHTAWKKNRKFGDVAGGRLRPKLADKVFNRQHSFLPPGLGEVIPMFIRENPSRDFYFPVTIEDIKLVLAQLPPEYTEPITHIWMRKMKKQDYLGGDASQACFVCGGKVNLIILYPFPADNKMRFGKARPTAGKLKSLQKFAAELQHDESGWWMQWEFENVRKYYLEALLLGTIGDVINSYYKRWWSKARDNHKHKYSDNFAGIWANKICIATI